MSEVVIPHSGEYLPPWSVVDCKVFSGKKAIVDTKGHFVAIGLSENMAIDFLQQLETNGHIEHD